MAWKQVALAGLGLCTEALQATWRLVSRQPS